MDLNEQGLLGNRHVASGIIEVRLICWKSLKSLQIAFAEVRIYLRGADVVPLPIVKVGEIVVLEDDWGSKLALSGLSLLPVQLLGPPFG